MKNCPACSCQCADNASFCASCGASLSESNTPAGSEIAIPPKKPIYKRFLFWLILLSIAVFIAKGITNLSYGMPLNDFYSDILFILFLSAIPLILGAIICAIAEKSSPANRKAARIIASFLYYLMFFCVASISFIGSDTINYDPNYTEEDRFHDYIIEMSNEIISERFEEAGYTITARTAREHRPVDEVDPGKYITTCLVTAEKGISGTKSFMCYVRFQKDSSGNWYCYDFDVSDWSKYE